MATAAQLAAPAIARPAARIRETPGTQAGNQSTAAGRPAWALAALLGAMFLGNVDVAIANVAGPSIRTGLHASGGELELIVSGYTLSYTMLLVTSARPGEARGYRPMFLAGLAGFTAASLACGRCGRPGAEEVKHRRLPHHRGTTGRQSGPLWLVGQLGLSGPASQAALS